MARKKVPVAKFPRGDKARPLGVIRENMQKAVIRLCVECRWGSTIAMEGKSCQVGLWPIHGSETKGYIDCPYYQKRGD